MGASQAHKVRCYYIPIFYRHLLIHSTDHCHLLKMDACQCNTVAILVSACRSAAEALGLSLQDKMNMPKLKAGQVINHPHSPQDNARAYNMTN